MTRRIAIAALLAGTALAAPALGQSTDEVAALRAQLAALQAQLDRLESQQQETAAEVASVRAAPAGDGKLPGAAPAPAPEPSVVAERADRGVVLTLGGRVNAAVLYAEQGDQDQVFVVDNDGSGSRFEFLAETDFGEIDGLGEVSTGVEIVISAEVNSTDEIDFGANDDNADENADLGSFRQAHWFVESERFGYLSIGQGDTAAEDTAHVDLSGTDFAGSGSDVDDIAGGLQFGDDLAREVSDGSILPGDDDDELDDFFDMQDGSRGVRVLYVTPDFNGFALKGSLANDDESFEGRDDDDEGGLQVAVGIEYEREFGEDGAFELEASYRREQSTETVDVLDVAGNIVGTDEEEFDDDFYVASASLLLDNGLNFTLAGSYGEIDGEDENPTAYFAKIGYRADLIALGETRFSLDYFRGRNNDTFAAPDGDLPTAESIGVFAVQDLRPLNTELYAGYRRYELDDVFLGDEELDVDGLNAFITGARVRF